MSTVEMVRPRIYAVPKCHESMGPKAVHWCRNMGMTLDPEQEAILEASLGVREDDRWQCSEVGVNEPRQNGKGEIVMGRELFGMYELGEMFLGHTAHEFKTAERHFERCVGTIERCPDLMRRVKRSPSGRLIGFRYSHGDEAIELDTDARLVVRTRTKGGMRGFDDVSLLVLDEAMIISEWALSSMRPTIRASRAPRGPQLWYLGSAADVEMHENAVVWARLRARGIAGGDPSLAYFEYSLDFDHPDDVPDEVAADPEVWQLVNPAIRHGRVMLETMADEFRSLSRRGFIVELLGVGDWPEIDQSSTGLMDSQRWRSLAGKFELDTPTMSIDVSPLRTWASICGAKKLSGKVAISLVDRKEGTGWIVERAVELEEELRPARWVMDEKGPAASLIPELEEAGIEVDTIDGVEYARSCGAFYDAFNQSTLVHDNHPALDAAVRGAAQRTLADAWAWSRKNSRADITPLVAATIAHRAEATAKDERKPVGVMFG